MDTMTSDPTTTDPTTFPEADIPDGVDPADVHSPLSEADVDPGLQPIGPHQLLTALSGLDPLALLRNPSLIRGPVELLQSAAAVAAAWNALPLEAVDDPTLSAGLDRLAVAVKAMGL